ncbi:hypothetical protein N7454_002444 [Penicillium verhagenii]|nr:hypothetical protein N7454_002444 [Penicillium verhagenii]
MSFLPSLRMSSSRLVQATYAIPATSALHTTAVRRGLKENDQSQHSILFFSSRLSKLTSIPDRDELAQHYESEKHAHLKKAKEGTAKWAENLASNSEAHVRDHHPPVLCNP